MALYQKKNGIRTLVNYVPRDVRELEEDDNGPSDEDCQKLAMELYHSNWDALGTKEQNEIYKKLGYPDMANSADTIPMDKGELVKEHEKLTDTLGKTAAELEAEKKKQEAELAEYKANASADEEKHLKDLEDRLQKATGKEAEKIQAEIDKILFSKKNSDNAIDLDAAALDAREGMEKGVSEANVRELIKQKYKFDERDDDILNAVMAFVKKQLKTNAAGPEIDWISQVCYELELIMGSTTSDTQAVMATPKAEQALNDSWKKNLSPKQAAEAIEKATRV
jgi:hypothetical protein